MWNNALLAESDETELVEGNHYFPPESVHRQFFRESDAHTVCGWKGTASYYDVVVDDQVNEQAAWFYSHPQPAASHIKDYVAFWKGIVISG